MSAVCMDRNVESNFLRVMPFVLYVYIVILM